MARPRDTRFYEIPLPDEIPKSQKWLISYHENCRRLVEYMEQQGYALDITDQRFHHEIYLSDARKVAPEKLKTVIRHPIR